MDSCFTRFHLRGIFLSRVVVTVLCSLLAVSAVAPLTHAIIASEPHEGWSRNSNSTTTSNASHLSISSTLLSATVGIPYSAVLKVNGGSSPYSFTLTGLLPAGLSLDSATGAISGTPTAAGTFYFKVTVRDQQGNSGDSRLSLLVRAGASQIAVQISPISTSLTSGATQQFAASVTGTSNTGVIWSASAGSISSTGLFTAPVVQTASAVTVTARSQASLDTRASATVTVTPTTSAPQIAVQISPASASLASGAQQQFTAGVSGTSNTAVNWSATGGSISSSGLFTAPSVQATSVATVTATSQASPSSWASASLSITAVPIVSVSVSPATTSVATGGSVQFSASVSGTSNLGVTWSAAYGTINQSGFYVAPSNSGTDTITAVSQADSTKYATALASVTTSKPPTVTPSSSGPDNRYCAPGNTVTSLSQDGPALPLQRCYNTDLSQTPSPGVVHGPYTTTSQVQSAISTAACGDTILIQAGSSLGGPPSSGVGTQITLPAKGCDDAHYITIQSTGVSDSRFPSEGTRMTPCWSGLASFPNRPAYSCPSPAVLTFQVVAPMGTSGAFIIKGDHYRIIGAEITRPSKPGLVYYLVFAPLGQTVQPNHWILDRSWIHGVNQDGHFPMAVGTTTDTNHGVFFSQGNYEAVIDSYISDIYCTGSTGGCSDAQAINGGIGGTTMTNWGAYKIVNNHLEGAAEGILFGGSGGPALTPSGCTVGVNCNIDVPADFEIRRNVFFKPQSWNGSTTTVNTYGWPVEKNGFEMKTGARLLVEGNVILNTWYDAQVGYAWDYAPKNQSGKNSSGVLVGTCATCMVTDVTHRYNYAYNVSYGMALYTSMDTGCSACQSQGANRISIHDNLIDWLNFGNLTGINGGDGQEFSANKGSPIKNVSISHNTTVAASRSFAIWGADGPGLMQNWTYQNNINANGRYGFMGMHVSAASCDYNLTAAYAILNNCVSPYAFDHNVIMSGAASGWPGSATGNGNWFPATSTVGFVNFNGGHGGDYHLISGSAFKNAGTDGKDVGADINAILTATAGVQ